MERRLSILLVVTTIVLVGFGVGWAVQKPNPETIGCAAVDAALFLWSIISFHAVCTKD